ncbi:MAG: TonB-dependent receptor plug domain-containing protein [Paludibacter sp.]|nr:TonB-dependent receptor plug domain-containing protein [Paludibacter sp.]
MRKITTSIFLVLFLFLSVPSYSATKIAKDFPQLITERFSRQWVGMPQEKVYLQTDKPYYSAGEDIWFKGYLVNATTLEPTAFSQFVYVELISKLDSVFYRIKIKKDSLGFAGHIKLKPEVPTGYYSLRAYTYWMQNTPDAFFFSKNILIGNGIDDRITSKITYGTPLNGLIPATLTFIDASKNPVAGKKVEIVQNWSSALKKKLNILTNKEGQISWQLSVGPNDISKKSIEVNVVDEKYKNNFFLPEFSKDYDVQFFPESGVLLNNDLQSIAFKAIGKDGLSVDVSGKVFNNKNEELVEFTTLHKGMGKFSIQTQPNESYYGLVKSADGTEKRFELPKTESEAVAIHLVNNRGKILYQIVNQTALSNKSLYLLIHSRGKVYVIQQLGFLEGQISESLLPAGIVSFSVVDSLGHTFCERLSFIRNNSFPTIRMDSNKPSYGKREPVDLSLNIQSILGKPVNGSYSISITDSRTVKLDSLADNIQSYLLLSSDIKGYVEDPGAYFVDNKIVTREKTDVLMLTQGWKRFNTADVVKGIYKPSTYYMEAGQALSGKVLNLFNKPSKNSNVIMITPYKNSIRIAKTDSLGRYLIDGIEFPDSTSFVLKARKPKSITDVEIIPDVDEYPKPGMFIPVPWNANAAAQEDYFKQSKEKYYTEGGMRAVNLAEVTVKAAKKQDLHSEYYSGMADNEINSEQLDKYPGMSIHDLLYTIPGIQVSGDKISIRGSLNNPMFLVDNIEMQDMDEISYMTSNDIENLQVFKGANAAIFGSRGGNGVIAITLKKGVTLKASTPISLTHVVPLGYQKPAQFYVPKYEVDSALNSPQPDLRTTIYWNPKLAADSNGNVHVKFYTADKANNYSVVLEGLTNKGEMCRYTGLLRRENR